MRPVIIYALVHPNTKTIRYIGKSVNPEKRFQDHLRARDKTPKDRWIKDLQKQGLEPEMQVLEKCAETNWKERERYWIRRMKKEGRRLLNKAPGGNWIPPKKRRAWLKKKRQAF